MDYVAYVLRCRYYSREKKSIVSLVSAILLILGGEELRSETKPAGAEQVRFMIAKSLSSGSATVQTSRRTSIIPFRRNPK